MTDREKLIDLLCKAHSKAVDVILSDDITYAQQLEIEADHLLANGVTFQKWIPVSERLPDLELVEVRTEDMDLFPCLVVKSAPQSPKKRFVTKAWYDGNGFMDTDCIWVTKSVTHWMPLPNPPKEDN